MKQLFILLIIPISCFSQSHFESANSTVLPLSEGKNVFSQYSRTGGPSIYDSLVNLSETDIEILNRNFGRIKKNQSTGCCTPGIKIKKLKNYAYQYVGVVIKGQRHIYINAFSLYIVEGDEEWRTKAIRMFDGGAGCWGVLFNIETQTFYNLYVNGSA